MNPNVLFIVVDSLRGDRIFNKSKTTVTPNIDSLINKGTYFSKCINSSDVTGICLGNIFTGMYSNKTGIKLRRFNPKIQTMFDLLRKNNYSLYATIPDLTWFNQLTTKFDYVDKFFSANRKQDGLSDNVGKQILEQLNSKKMHEPWFYYIHLQDLHDEIIVPDEFDNEKFGNSQYDRMVSFIDQWVGNFLNLIDLNSTLVVITSDHGEYIHHINNVEVIPKVQSFMREGKKLFPKLEPLGLKIFILIRKFNAYFQRKKLKKKLTSEQFRTLNTRGQETLYDETLNVPLLFVGKGISPQISDTLVSGVDILPTIMNHLQLPFDSSPIDGRNLGNLSKNIQINEVPIFIESGDTQEHKEGLVIGIRNSKFKYFRSRKNPKKNIHLYNLELDPKETNNIANSNPDMIKTMEKFLKKFQDNSNNITLDDDENTKNIEEELKKLGYV